MGYVPGFDYDVFISYARRDDDHAQVAEFTRRLNEYLTSKLVPEFRDGGKIFFDQHNLNERPTDWRAELPRGAARSALFVPVLSPNWAASEYCNMEWEAFRDGGEPLTLRIAEKPVYRVAPVQGWPIDEELRGQVPQEIRNAQRPDFDLDSMIADATEDSGADWIERFGQFIANGLRLMRLSKRTVYLGETPGAESSAGRARKRLKDELVRRGFRVEPQVPGAFQVPDTLQELLGGAVLAVHFIGGQNKDRPLDWILRSADVCAGQTIVYQAADLTEVEMVFHDMLREPTKRDEKKEIKSRLSWGVYQTYDHFLGELLVTLDPLLPQRALSIALVYEGEDRELAERAARKIHETFCIEVLCLRLGPDALHKIQKFACVYYWGRASGRHLLMARRLRSRRAWYLEPPPRQNREDLDGEIHVIQAESSEFEFEKLRAFLEEVKASARDANA